MASRRTNYIVSIAVLVVVVCLFTSAIHFSKSLNIRTVLQEDEQLSHFNLSKPKFISFNISKREVKRREGFSPDDVRNETDEEKLYVDSGQFYESDNEYYENSEEFEEYYDD